jgi:hypothetical protein
LALEDYRDRITWRESAKEPAAIVKSVAGVLSEIVSVVLYVSWAAWVVTPAMQPSETRAIRMSLDLGRSIGEAFL